LKADIVLCIGNSLNQHATFNYRGDLFEDKKLIHISISEDEIDKAHKADYDRLRCSPSGRSPRRCARAEGRRGREVDVDGKDYEARHIIHLTDSDSPRRARADDRTDASRERFCSRTPAPTWRACVLRRAEDGQNFQRPARWPDGRTRQWRHRSEDGASRPGRRRRLYDGCYLLAASS
jgi:acetolactate synthase-1/2/3 large subunit